MIVILSFVSPLSFDFLLFDCVVFHFFYLDTVLSARFFKGISGNMYMYVIDTR